MSKRNRAFDHSKYRDWISQEDVQPYERNAKIHTERQIDNIANSIARFGWQQDCVITTDNVLVIGHGRRLAAMKLCSKMPYHRIDKAADELTDEDIRELRIADNQTNAETGLDMETLEQEFADLSFDGFDFDFVPEALPTDGEIEAGEIEDNTGNPVQVKIVFEDAEQWRHYENDVRDFVDGIDGVRVCVGEYEDKQSDI